jgi:protein-tyrosine-phosphatase
MPALRAARTAAVLVAGALAGALSAMADARAQGAPVPASPYVLFVCEHGNVKSLMAAQYFARLAAARGLPLGAEARGTAPNSASVPPPIVAGLRGDGYDVATFVPQAVTAADLAGALRVVVIGVTLPAHVATGTAVIEHWDDVPAASEDFAAARAALLRHLDALLRELPTH